MMIVMKSNASKIENNYLLHLKEAIRRKLEKDDKEYTKTFDEKLHYTKNNEYLTELVQTSSRKKIKVFREDDEQEDYKQPIPEVGKEEDIELVEEKTLAKD